MSEIMKSLFTNYIPTNSIHGNHIDTNKMSEEYKQNAMKNFIPREQKNPSDKDISKMAHSAGKKIAQNEQDIKRDNKSWKQTVESNKSKKTTDLGLGLNGIRIAHLDGDPIVDDKPITPELYKQVLKKNENYLQKSSAYSTDNIISESSRQEFRNDRREKLDQSLNKREIKKESCVRSTDRDPITGIRKGIANISEVVQSSQNIPLIRKPIPTQKQEEDKINNIVTAIELMKEHNAKKITSMNSSKSDWIEDSLSRTHERVAKSVESLRSNQKNNIENHNKSTVSPAKVADTFRQYFQERNTHLAQLSDDISDYKKIRSESIKRQRTINTSLDQPSLPSRTSNGSTNTIDSLISRLPEYIKEKALKK